MHFQARILSFLEKTKKKRPKGNMPKGEPEALREEFLRKKVIDLIKKQKLRQVTQIVKRKDDSEPWGVEAHAKVLDMSTNQMFVSLVYLFKLYLSFVGWVPSY